MRSFDASSSNDARRFGLAYVRFDHVQVALQRGAEVRRAL
jgi:hypothetical protein